MAKKPQDTPGIKDADIDGPNLKDFAQDDVKASKAKVAAKSANPSTPKKPRAPKTPKVKKERSGVSFPLALGMSVIAALAGGIGGWMGPKIFDPANAAPAEAITRNASKLADLDSSLTAAKRDADTLKTRVSSAEKTLNARSGQAELIAELQASVSDLSAIDHSAERKAAMDPVMTRLGAIETIITPEGSAEGEVDGDVVESAQAGVSALLSRIDALETQLTEMRAQPPVSLEPAILSYTTPADEAGESAAAASEPEKTSDTASVPDVYNLIDNFPRDAMLKALSVQSQNTEQPSWLRRMIGKHVQTDDLTVADSKAAVLNAERLTRAGDIDGAITQIESLNPTLRAAAHGWLIEAKKQR